jgi:methylphosphotriester-DNA--protein-cysteine methyltransferase
MRTNDLVKAIFMWVELVRLYSNPPWSPSRWLHLRADALSHRRPCTETAPRTPQRVSHRLGSSTLEQIAAEYEAGASKQVLAQRYGVSLSSVKRLLKRHLM